MLALTILSSWLAVQKTTEIKWPEFQVNRAEALALAKHELEAHGVVLEGDWRSVVLTGQGWGGPRDFVWRELGKTRFQSLLGSFLDTGYWEITWRKFDGPIEQRTERWIVLLRPDGSLYDLVHDLPEAAPGARLTAAQAVAKARQWVLEQKWAQADQLEEKSAAETILANRSNWRITFVDKTAFDHKSSQAFIAITLNGDEVTASLRSIDVAQEWQRSEAEKQGKKSPYTMAKTIAFFILALLALSSYMRKYQGGKFSLGLTLPWLFLIAGSMIVDALLWLDTASINFQTNMNWWVQLATSLAWKFFYAAVAALVIAVMLQAIYAVRPTSGSRVKHDFALGASLALIAAITQSLIAVLIPSYVTPVPNTGDWASYIPWLSTTINATKTFYMAVITIILVWGLVRFNKSRLHLSVVVVLAVIAWLGSAFAAQDVVLTLANQGVKLLMLVALWLLLARQQLGAAIAMLGIGIALDRLQVGAGIYPWAWLHAGVAATVTAIISYGLVWHWHHHKA